MQLILELIFLALAIAWAVLVCAMLVGTVLLAIAIAWDFLVAFIVRYSQRHRKEDEVAALEKLYRNSK